MFSRLTTPPPQEETNTNPRIARPKYEVRNTQRRIARLQANTPVWPITDTCAKPSTIAISDLEQALSYGKHGPKPLRTEGASTRNTTNKSKMSSPMAHNSSQRRASVKAFEKRKSPYGSSTHYSGSWGVEPHRWNRHPAKGRRLPQLQCSPGQREWKATIVG